MERPSDLPPGIGQGDTRNEFSGTAEIVVQAREVHGGLNGHPAPLRPLPRPQQLPPDSAHFTDREAELAELDGLLLRESAVRPSPAVISAVAGTAGVGKTALAIHWAHLRKDRFPGGNLYADLHGYDLGVPAEASEILNGFLRALDVASENIPTSWDAQQSLYRTLLSLPVSVGSAELGLLW